MSNVDFVITRTFNAPRALVWQAWTERDMLMQWFGPKGMKMVRADLDFRVGGAFLYGLRQLDGDILWGKWVFREIAPEEKLVLVSSFSNEAGEITRHPMAPIWPAQTLSTTTFSEQNGKTTLTLHWTPHNASAEEIAMFAASHASMNGGWGGTMEQLEDFLAKAQKH